MTKTGRLDDLTKNLGAEPVAVLSGIVAGKTATNSTTTAMIDLPKARYEISYAEMVQDQDGLYRQGEAIGFGDDCALNLTAAVCYSAAEAIASWTCWMIAQGFEVTEIPRTERTRG